MDANRYKVPLRSWRKWSPLARAVFNNVYGSTVFSQNVLAPPSASKLPHQAWKVLCWNFAWIAADAVRDEAKEKAA